MQARHLIIIIIIIVIIITEIIIINIIINLFMIKTILIMKMNIILHLGTSQQKLLNHWKNPFVRFMIRQGINLLQGKIYDQHIQPSILSIQISKLPLHKS